MKGYSIHYLEQLTGIKAHTIRIWEQRYNLLHPERSAANTRMYHDDDLKKVLSISTLLNAGYKIGDLAPLSIQQIKNRIDELNKSVLDDEKLDFANINALIAASMEYNEISFEQIVTAAVNRFGWEHTYLYIIHPFLVRIGALWNVGDMMPAQEHFISNLIRQKLYAAIDGVDLNHNGEPWILFLPENEEHEMGLLFANFLLRFYGKKTIYLGQRVPQENVQTVVTTLKPSGIICFQVAQATEVQNKKLNEWMLSLADIQHKIICCPYSSNQYNAKGELTLIHSATEFINWLKSNK